MNKQQLVARMARDARLTKAAALRALDAFLDNVTRSLKKGEKVTLVDFGTFRVARRRARTVLNPRSGAPVKIAARRVARFHMGKGLKGIVK
jgi:DNA-binding protein HU-beta